jgi:hypothetical protein
MDQRAPPGRAGAKTFEGGSPPRDYETPAPAAGPFRPGLRAATVACFVGFLYFGYLSYVFSRMLQQSAFSLRITYIAAAFLMLGLVLSSVACRRPRQRETKRPVAARGVLRFFPRRG